MKVDRTIAPPIKPLADFQLRKAEAHTLQNGVLVYTINAGEQPVLQLQLLFPAGKAYEAHPGVASFTAKMLLEGTKTSTSQAIHHAFDSIGAFKEIQAGFNYGTIEVYLLERYLSTVATLIGDIFQEATFPENELASQQQITKQQILVNQEKTGYLSTVLYRDAFFGNSPYGYSLTVEQTEQISREMLVSHYEKCYLNTPFIIILAGQVTDRHIGQLDNTLGTLPFETSKNIVEPHQVLPSVTPKSIYVEKDDALQTSLRIGGIGVPLTHPSRAVFDVLNHALGGYFGSRLMQNIREEKGLTYGISSQLTDLKIGNFFTIATDVQKAQREVALTEIYKEIERLQQEEIPHEELELVKYYMVSSFMRSINTPIALAEYFKTVHIHGLPPDYFDGYISRVQEVSAADIKKAAQEYLKLPLLEVCVG